MTTCTNHPDVPAESSCAGCGAGTCAACDRRVHGVSWCESCLAARLAPPQAASPPPFVPPLPATVPQLKSPALAALLSVFPGLGNLYNFNGPAPRPVVQFITWALLLWGVRHSHGFLTLVFVLAWLAYYAWQAIDAHATARAFNALGRIPDAAEAEAMGRGALPARDPEARALGIALLCVGAVLLAFEMTGATLALRWAWPLALVVAGVIIVLRARRRPALGDA